MSDLYEDDKITPDDLYDYLEKYGLPTLLLRYFDVKRRVEKFNQILQVSDAVLTTSAMIVYQRDKKLLEACQVVLRGRIRAAGFQRLDQLPALIDKLYSRDGEEHDV